MDGQLFLRTLGVPALFAPNGDPIRFRVKKHVALLVYLAVEQRSAHRRDHLVNLLWPRASAADGRHSLSTALSVLRAKLGRAAVETTRDTIRLASGVVALDLTRLEAGEVLADEARPELEVAAFLDGFDPSDADEFLRWSERLQARLLPAILKAMIVLIDRCRRTADTRTMERLADRMIALDPLSEDAVRAKMESRAFDGDRLTALRVFEEWKEMLARDLGAVPSELVDGIAVRLRRRGWERSANDRIPSVRTDQWRGRPFIGRQAEYRVLYEGWERTQRGEPGHALVRGDSGVGKTTLVERLSTAAGLEGASVSRVQCYELEREIPYSVVSGLVVGLLDRPGVTATSPEALAELGRIVPQIRERFSNLPTPVESQGETVRVRLADAFYEMILALAGEHPVILVVDDLHLADDASLAVLHLLIRRAHTQPIMVVLAVRPGELGQSPHAARLLESAGTLGFRSVAVPPMNDEEACILLDSLIPAGEAKPTGAARWALLKAAAGHPMVLELLVQDWQANGERSLALSLKAMTADLVLKADVSAYNQIVDQICRALDPVTRSVLDLAALLGHRLNDLGMYSLADLAFGHTMRGLDQLTSLRVLRDGSQGLEFVNELVRACAYHAVPSPVRRELHSRIADRLLAQDSRVREQCGLEIAWHCIRGARLDQAVPYLLQGASAAIRAGAPHEAERALATGSSHFQGEFQVQAAALLAEALQEQGDWAGSLRVIEGALPTAKGANAELLRVQMLFSQQNAQAATTWLGVEQLEELWQVMESSPEPKNRLKAASVAANLAGMLMDAYAARRSYALAQRILPGTQEDDLTLSCARRFLQTTAVIAWPA
jgi:DNA-binding SARP family transcriptional activator